MLSNVSSFFYTQNASKTNSSTQVPKILKNRLKQKKIINKNSGSHTRVKRAMSKNEMRCRNALLNILYNTPLKLTIEDLKGLKCDFSKENRSDDDPFTVNGWTHDIYNKVQKFFNDFNQVREGKNSTLIDQQSIDQQSKDLSLHYEYFTLINFLVFNSEGSIPSDVINAYLTTFTTIMDRFWNTEDNQISELQKPHLKKIFDSYLSYNFTERCTSDQCQEICTSLQNSISYGFLASTLLYPIKEEWDDFIKKYLEYLDRVFNTIPGNNKKDVENVLIDRFRNFLKAKGLGDDRIESLKNQLFASNSTLQSAFTEQTGFHLTSTTSKPTTTTTPKPTTTTTTTPKPTTTTTTTKTTTPKLTSVEPTIQQTATKIASLSPDRP
jgi:hypothetical protein